jgi:hypothetical protein
MLLMCEYCGAVDNEWVVVVFVKIQHPHTNIHFMCSQNDIQSVPLFNLVDRTAPFLQFWC